MKSNLTLSLTVALVASLLVISCSPPDQEAAPGPTVKTGLTAEQVEEAYIWGLPIVAMYRYSDLVGTRINAINRLVHNRQLFEPGLKGAGPNRDTLYSHAWFDLVDEPMVVSLPDFGDRYFVWQMTDLYSHNFHNVGSHLREGPTEKYRSGYTFMVAPPDWKGDVPDGVELVRSPVRMFHIVVRISVKNEPEDIAAANALQDATVTMSLSAWQSGKRSSVDAPPSEPAKAYRDVLAFGEGVSGKDQRNPDFFSVLADAISINTPYTEWDQAVVDGPLAALGVGAGRSFDFEAFDEDTQTLILDAQERAHDRVLALKESGWGPLINGWQYGPPNHGNYREDFLRRAYGTYTGAMWPTNNNSTYATAFVDREGMTLNGANQYRIKFEANAIPPSTAFWSLTVYDAGTFDLHPNDANRYLVGSNNPDTEVGNDGSVEILFSHDRPEVGGTANWLPVPQSPFYLAIRFYAPTPEVLSLEYEVPGVIRLN